MIKRITLLKVLAVCVSITTNMNSMAQPVRLAVAGISHGHSTWILGKKSNDKVIVTGIYEKDTTLW